LAALATGQCERTLRIESEHIAVGVEEEEQAKASRRIETIHTHTHVHGLEEEREGKNRQEDKTKEPNPVSTIHQTYMPLIHSTRLEFPLHLYN